MFVQYNDNDLEFLKKKITISYKYQRSKLSGVVYIGALWTFFYYAKIVVLLGFTLLSSPIQSMGHVKVYSTPFSDMYNIVG